MEPCCPTRRADLDPDLRARPPARGKALRRRDASARARAAREARRDRAEPVLDELVHDRLEAIAIGDGGDVCAVRGSVELARTSLRPWIEALARAAGIPGP